MGNVKAKDVWVWVDFEGGMNKEQPLWDAAFCFDSPGKPLDCVRIVHMSKARHRCAICKSLPRDQASVLKMHQTYVMKYNEKFDLKSLECEKGSMQKVVQRYLPEEGSTVLAWNMMGHDKKVLQNLQSPKYVLLDPLRAFRKQIGLPKNTLGSNKPGTPRNALNVPIMGPPHTAIADALHMREVTRRAALVLAQPGKMNFNMDFNAANDDEIACALKAFMQPPKLPPTVQKVAPKWLWSSTYWDENQRLRPEHSKAYKQRVREWAKITGSALNAVKKQETVRRLLEKHGAI